MLWIDVTDTYLNWSGSPTGIQRTLMGLAGASKKIPNCALCAWDKNNNSWKVLEYSDFISIFTNKIQSEGLIEYKKDHNTKIITALKFSIFIILNTLKQLIKQLMPYFITKKLISNENPQKLIKDINNIIPIKRITSIVFSSRRNPRLLRKPRKYTAKLLGIVSLIMPTYIIQQWVLYSSTVNNMENKNRIKNIAKEKRHTLLQELKTNIEWGSGDAILIADSCWNQRGFLSALTALKNHPHIIGFCYDLIPIDRPDFVPEPARVGFTQWILELLANSSEFVCISEYTAKKVKNLIENKLLYLPNLNTVRSIPFGNEIEHLDRDKHPNASLGDILDIHKFSADLFTQVDMKATSWILWIGSIDVRKNLDVLFLALECLAAKGITISPVIIAGRPAGGFDYYQSKIRNNPILNKMIVFIQSPSDELVYDIQMGTKLFTFTSWEEGYGLPVAESLQMGIPVIASRSTSIPEVAGCLVEYFDPWDSKGLAELIERFESNENYREELKQRARGFTPTSWHTTLSDIKNGPNQAPKPRDLINTL